MMARIVPKASLSSAVGATLGTSLQTATASAQSLTPIRLWQTASSYLPATDMSHAQRS